MDGSRLRLCKRERHGFCSRCFPRIEHLINRRLPRTSKSGSLQSGPPISRRHNPISLSTLTKFKTAAFGVSFFHARPTESSKVLSVISR
jgi:hypothetical protein